MVASNTSSGDVNDTNGNNPFYEGVGKRMKAWKRWFLITSRQPNAMNLIVIPKWYYSDFFETQNRLGPPKSELSSHENSMLAGCIRAYAAAIVAVQLWAIYEGTARWDFHHGSTGCPMSWLFLAIQLLAWLMFRKEHNPQWSFLMLKPRRGRYVPSFKLRWLGNCSRVTFWWLNFPVEHGHYQKIPWVSLYNVVTQCLLMFSDLKTDTLVGSMFLSLPIW